MDSDFATAAMTMRVLDAAERSAAQGRPIVLLDPGAALSDPGAILADSGS